MTDPINEIRRIAAEYPHTWIGRCFLRYITEPGLSLDDCCGLSASRHQSREDRLDFRNACLRWYGCYVTAREPMSARSQAAAVHEAAERYRHGRWRFDQFLDGCPTNYRQTKSEILYKLFRVSKDLNAPVPGERQIRRLLGPPACA